MPYRAGLTCQQLPLGSVMKKSPSSTVHDIYQSGKQTNSCLYTICTSLHHLLSNSFPLPSHPFSSLPILIPPPSGIKYRHMQATDKSLSTGIYLTTPTRLTHHQASSSSSSEKIQTTRVTKSITLSQRKEEKKNRKKSTF